MNKRCLGLTLLWVCIIFSFSLQPAEVSHELSAGVGIEILETFFPALFEKLDSIPKEQLDFWHFLLRKAGHFSEYLILGVLSLLTLLRAELKYKEIKALGFCVMIASIDETIQLFVSGRSGQISDVALDSIGALTGILFVCGAKFLWSKRKQFKK